MSACSAAGTTPRPSRFPIWFGLRRRPLEVVVYDDVVMMVATRPDGKTHADARKSLASARRGGQKIRGGAVLFKYFRHIARADLKALFPNVRVVMSLADHLTLARAGGRRRRADPDQARLDHDGAVSSSPASISVSPARSTTTTSSRRWPR